MLGLMIFQCIQCDILQYTGLLCLMSLSREGERSICFWRQCIQKRRQVFREEENETHRGHEQYCRGLNEEDVGRMIEEKGPCIEESKTLSEAYLANVLINKLNSLAVKLQDKYKALSKKIVNSKLAKFESSSCKSILKRVSEERNSTQDLWLLNNIFYGEEDMIRQGLVSKMMLLANHLGEEFEKEIAIMSELLINHDFKMISQHANPPQEASDSSQPRIKEEDINVNVNGKKQVIQALQLKGIVEEEREEGQISSSKHSEGQQKIDTLRKLPARKAKTKLINKKAKKPKYTQNTKSDQQYKPTTEKPVKRVQEENSINPSTYQINGMSDFMQLKRLKNAIHQKLVVNFSIEQVHLIEAINRTEPKEIIINTYVNFSNSFIRSIKPSIMQNLLRFEELWDFNHYYERYSNFLYFPSDEEDIDYRKKLHFYVDTWKGLHHIKNIWISSHKDLQELRRAKFNSKNITSLRIQPCNCCRSDTSRLLTDEILKQFKHVNTLETLIINKLIFDRHLNTFLAEIIKNNPGLSCLILNNNDKIENRLIKIISKLKLRKLLIRNFEVHRENMDYSPIFKIETLEYLTLQKVSLAGGGTAVETAMRRISNLKNLVHLDLDDCSPINSNILAHLHTDTYSSLKHLNLGQVQIEDQISNLLKRFRRLEELNLDSTNLNLAALLKDLIRTPMRSIKKLSIFNYFDEDQYEKRLSNEEFAQLAEAFPGLTYLDIGYDSRLTEINLKDFKNLQYLIVNEQLADAINMHQVGNIQIITTKHKEKHHNL